MNSEGQKRVEVCFSPNLYPLHKEANHKIVVVIDVLRATSAICTALDNGIESIKPVSDIEEAREYSSKDYIVGAERQGQIVEGFEYGNSPHSYMDESVAGRKMVLTTTNGTRAINIASDSECVAIGALVNLQAISDWLIEQNESTLLLCSGWKDKFNLEDTICAGAIADILINSGKFTSEHDSSVAAKYLSRSAADNYFGFLKSSSHRRRLKKLNLNRDIKYCLTPNSTNVVPILKDGVIVKIR